MGILYTLIALAGVGLLAITYLHHVKYHDWTQKNLGVGGVAFLYVGGQALWLLIMGEEPRPEALQLVLLILLALFVTYYGCAAVVCWIKRQQAKWNEEEQQAFDSKVRQFMHENSNPVTRRTDSTSANHP